MGGTAAPRSRKRWLRMLSLMALIVAGLLLVEIVTVATVGGIPEPWSRRLPKVKTTIQRGDRLVDAIRAYRERTGKLPMALGHLVPRYIRDVPRHVAPIGRRGSLSATHVGRVVPANCPGSA